MPLTLARRAFPELPENVADVLATSLYTEFASVTAKGVPLDTPLFAFVEPTGGTIDVATGLAYPAKANRVRRNPKVGLLLEGNGNPGDPVVSVAGFGAVRDSDIQANIERYLAETAARLPVTSGRHALVDRAPGRLVLGSHHRADHALPYCVVARRRPSRCGAIALERAGGDARSHARIHHPPDPRPRPPHGRRRRTGGHGPTRSSNNGSPGI